MFWSFAKYQSAYSIYNPLHQSSLCCPDTMSSSDSTPVQVVTPDSSKSDPRSFRFIELPNGLQCTLITDPNTTKEAAAVLVEVGAFSDPSNLPGMAHFCEHMLFLGTDEFPDEAEYRSYLGDHGGSNNALTENETTTYFFDVKAGHLDHMLSMLSRFFIAPLFAESATSRELNAINSERAMQDQNDYFRGEYLLRSSSGIGHPLANDMIGSRESLSSSSNLREDLLAFFDANYSANRMKLVVLGQDNLDHLQESVMEKFKHVVNKQLPVDTCPARPFEGGSALGNILHFKPTTETRMLTMVWQLESTSTLYSSRPLEFVGKLIQRGGEGSPLAVLQKLGLANLINCVCEQLSGYSLLKVLVLLTPAGVGDINQVAATVADFIKMIQEADETTLERLFNEMQKTAQQEFDTKTVEIPVLSCVSIAKHMRVCSEPSDILTSQSLFLEYDERVIRQVLSDLTADFCMIVQCPEAGDLDLDRIEPHFQTPFASEPFSSDLRTRLNQVTTNGALKLPAVSCQLEASDLSLKYRPEDAADSPYLISHTDSMSLWHQPLAMEPRAQIWATFYSPEDDSSARISALKNIYCAAVMEATSALRDEATQAGITLNVNEFSVQDRISIILNGFDERIHDVLQRCFDIVDNLDIEDTRFEALRTQCAAHAASIFQFPPFQYGMMVGTSAAVLKWPFGLKDIIHVFSELTADDLRSFARNALTSGHWETLVCGNVLADEASAIGATISRRTTVGIARKDQPLINQVVKLPFGRSWKIEQVENPAESNSAVIVLYQLAHEKDERVAAASYVLASMMAAPVMQKLRTEQQLGYVVLATFDKKEAVHGLQILVQSAEYSPKHVYEKINEFVRGFGTVLSELSDQELEIVCHSSANMILEKPRSVQETCQQMFPEINTGRLCFGMRQIRADQIKAVTRDDLVHLIDNLLNGDQRRELVAVFHSASHDVSDLNAEREPAFETDNERALQATLELWPPALIDVDHLLPASSRD